MAIRLEPIRGRETDPDYIGVALPCDRQPSQQPVDCPVDVGLRQRLFAWRHPLGLENRQRRTQPDARVGPLQDGRLTKRAVEFRIFGKPQPLDHPGRQRPRTQYLHFAVDGRRIRREARHHRLQVGHLHLLPVEQDQGLGRIERCLLENPDHGKRRHTRHDGNDEAEALSERPVKRHQVEIEKPVRSIAFPARMGRPALDLRGRALDRCIHLWFPQPESGGACAALPFALSIAPNRQRNFRHSSR